MGVDVQNMIYYSHLERNAKDELLDIDRLGLSMRLWNNKAYSSIAFN